MNNQSLGKIGENFALDYYLKNGYNLVEKNFQFYGQGRGRKGEIDLIFEKNNLIVLVEVKTRSSNKFGKPIEQVTPGQIKRIRRSYEYFCSKNKTYKNKFVRIDIALVEKEKLTVVENVN